jgi:hypothetical protein
MTHTDIIIVVGIVSSLTGVLLYGCIRSIPASMPTPTNVLTRRNSDMELQDTVDPIHSNFHGETDLSSLPEYPQAVINYSPVR